MYAIIISMPNEMISKSLKALSDPTRLHIVELLSNRCCGEGAVREDGSVEGPTAGEVCCHLTGAEKINSTISHHLHELEGAGLVRLERRGKAMLCTINPKAFSELSKYLEGVATGLGAGCC